MAFAGRWVGARATVALDRAAASDAAHHLYGEASLRRRVERDRHVARRACVRGRRALWHAAAGALRALRLVRLRLFQRLGSRERDASADDSRVWDERQSAPTHAWRAAAALFAHPTLLPDDAGVCVADL